MACWPSHRESKGKSRIARVPLKVFANDFPARLPLRFVARRERRRRRTWHAFATRAYPRDLFLFHIYQRTLWIHRSLTDLELCHLASLLTASFLLSLCSREVAHTRTSSLRRVARKNFSAAFFRRVALIPSLRRFFYSGTMHAPS